MLIIYAGMQFKGTKASRSFKIAFTKHGQPKNPRFRGPLIGQIFVTNYRFIFKAEVSNTIFLQVPLNSLSKGIIRNIFFYFWLFGSGELILNKKSPEK